MPFDFRSALQSGYSMQEIMNYLNQKTQNMPINPMNVAEGYKQLAQSPTPAADYGMGLLGVMKSATGNFAKQNPADVAMNFNPGGMGLLGRLRLGYPLERIASGDLIKAGNLTAKVLKKGGGGFLTEIQDPVKGNYQFFIPYQDVTDFVGIGVPK